MFDSNVIKSKEKHNNRKNEDVKKGNHRFLEWREAEV